MPFTYLALGDSYTIGEQVSLYEAFPTSLYNYCVCLPLIFWPRKLLLKQAGQQMNFFRIWNKPIF